MVLVVTLEAMWTLLLLQCLKVLRELYQHRGGRLGKEHLVSGG